MPNEETKTASYPIAAKWSDDCQGKKDYDGRIVSISTRYWPERDYRRNHGHSGKVMKPSAVSEIHIHYGEPDEYGYTYDDIKLIKAEFEADTEAEVKAQVEAWAQEQMNRVVKALKNEFGVAQ